MDFLNYPNPPRKPVRFFSGKNCAWTVPVPKWASFAFIFAIGHGGDGAAGGISGGGGGGQGANNLCGSPTSLWSGVIPITVNTSGDVSVFLNTACTSPFFSVGGGTAAVTTAPGSTGSIVNSIAFRYSLTGTGTATGGSGSGQGGSISASMPVATNGAAGGGTTGLGGQIQTGYFGIILGGTTGGGSGRDGIFDSNLRTGIGGTGGGGNNAGTGGRGGNGAPGCGGGGGGAGSTGGAAGLGGQAYVEIIFI